MWTPTTLMIICLGSAIFAAVAAFVLARKSKRAEESVQLSPDVTRRIREINPGEMKLDIGQLEAHENFGTRTSQPSIKFTRRQLADINLRRQLAGKPMLSARGFEKAVWSANGETVRPATHDDWVTWFLIYEVFFASDQTRVPAVSDSFHVHTDSDHCVTAFTPAPQDSVPSSPMVAPNDPYAAVAAAVEGPSGARAADALSAPYSAPEPTPAPAVADAAPRVPDAAPAPDYTPPAPSYSDPAPASYTPDPTPSYSAPADTGGGSFSVDTGSSF